MVLFSSNSSCFYLITMNIKGLGSQWLATGYVGLISMLLTFLYGRMLGPENFGEFSYFLTLGAQLKLRILLKTSFWTILVIKT